MNAAEIAKWLSEAQKKALLWLPANSGWIEHTKGSPSRTSLYCMSRAVKGDPRKVVAITYSLCEKRAGTNKPKGEFWPNNEWRSTPLGLEVRAILEGAGA
jgi:hypothetical protein